MMLNDVYITKERKRKVAKNNVYISSTMREDLLVANLAECMTRIDVLKNICTEEVKRGGTLPCVTVQEISNVFGWDMGTEDKRWR